MIEFQVQQIGGLCKDCRWWAGGDKANADFFRCDMMTAHDGESLIKYSMAYSKSFGHDGLSVVFTQASFGCVMFEPHVE